jgi:putative phosphoribosyl transferase
VKEVAVLFTDRVDAGRRLAEMLRFLAGEDVVVVGLPRGGVPVAFEVARGLGVPMDVIVVRKLGVPFQPELGMGAVGEGGVRVINDKIVQLGGVGPAELAGIERRERAEVEQRARRLRGDKPAVRLAGRTVVVVDDGIATGSTARAACQIARAQGAVRVVLAVPVGPKDVAQRIGGDADQVVCIYTPTDFFAIGQFYEDFAQTTDQQVVELLRRAAELEAGMSPAGVPVVGDPPARDQEVIVHAGPVELAGHLTAPGGGHGLVVFAHGSGSSRQSPRNRYVADELNAAGLGTLLFDLLTPAEEADRRNVFDIALLAARLIEVTRWLRAEPDVGGRPLGYFGASTGAAAALSAAAELGRDVAAVVSRGGRPDLAGRRLALVTAPTLLIVGGHDPVVLDLNRAAQRQLRCENRLAIVPGATHLFEEPGTLAQVARLAAAWFIGHLAPLASTAA